ncbi:MAG TPA: protease modulator HflC [Buchnera sp. (in: enterobacteria)]|nr:protease modulator HflC [Buchnera sp. (in: enterobacteria)]
MNKIYIILLGIVCFVLCTSFFLIEEGECGILLRFGTIVKNRDKAILIYKPGLHYKLPLLDTVKKINFKIQTTEHRSHIFVAKEQKDFIIDFYIKWKINNISRYYLFAQDNDNYYIEFFLKRKFNDILHSEIKKSNKNSYIIDKINLFNKKAFKKCNFLINNNIKEQYFSFEKIMNNSSITDLGINIVDISIKKIALPTEILHNIYYRMKLDNELLTRSEMLKGQVISEKIKSEADRKVIKILSDAKKKALVIQGESKVISMKLLSGIFIKEPNLYCFSNSLGLQKYFQYLK